MPEPKLARDSQRVLSHGLSPPPHPPLDLILNKLASRCESLPTMPQELVSPSEKAVLIRQHAREKGFVLVTGGERFHQHFVIAQCSEGTGRIDIVELSGE